MPATTTRLDFRLGPALKRRIEEAASLRGQTVSSFAVSVLVSEANRVLAESAAITLNAKASREFLDRLDKDLKPNRKLRRAARRHRELIS